MISRRKWIAAAPAVFLAACKDSLPPAYGTLFDVSNSLTFSSHRLLLRNQPLVREFGREMISKNFPAINETNPKNDRYQQLLAGGFSEWRLPVAGLVSKPVELSLDTLKRYPARTQVTQHSCEQGWSAIAEWTGVQLPVRHGAPVRLRVERQLGYKSLKFLSRIDVTDRLDDTEDGTGAVGAAYGYSWYAGI
jgi:DMSO/TMAO reductase YedYZ molybdopterin-dependent catalytic subunit